jgi:hypothetical protein
MPRRATRKTVAVKKAPQGAKKSPVRKRAGGAKKKDPHKVKRARSAYIFFSKEKQSEFEKSTPVPERGRIIGAAWRNMSASEKEPYEKMAEKDKKRAERERAAHK